MTRRKTILSINITVPDQNAEFHIIKEGARHRRLIQMTTGASSEDRADPTSPKG